MIISIFANLTLALSIVFLVMEVKKPRGRSLIWIHGAFSVMKFLLLPYAMLQEDGGNYIVGVYFLYIGVYVLALVPGLIWVKPKLVFITGIVLSGISSVLFSYEWFELLLGS